MKITEAGLRMLWTAETIAEKWPEQVTVECPRSCDADVSAYYYAGPDLWFFAACDCGGPWTACEVDELTERAQAARNAMVVQ